MSTATAVRSGSSRSSCRERASELFVATKFGRRGPHEVAEYTYDNLRAWLERSLREPRHRRGRSGPAPLPAAGCVLHARGVRRVDRLVDEGSRALRRQRREGRGGAEGDRVPGRLDGADHLQHLPAAAGRPLLRAGAAARRRGDRARAARVGPADRQVRRATRPLRPTTTAPSTATASSSTWARRSPASTSSSGLRSSRSSRAGSDRRDACAARPSWILEFDAVSTIIPGAKTPEQAFANAAASDLPALPDDSLRTIAEIYGEQIAPQVHQRW